MAVPEVILLAGGSGRRFSALSTDKTLLPIDGKSCVRRALEAFRLALPEATYVLVFRDEAQRFALSSEATAAGIQATFVQGGDERSDSVQAGLQKTQPGSQVVLIHDAARGLIHPESIRAVHAAAARDGGAVLAHPVTDTIKRVQSPEETQKTLLEDLDRSLLWAMETPQAFHRDAVVEAYERLAGPATDDTAVFNTAGKTVTLVPNPHPNPKLTHPSDVAYFETLLANAKHPAQ